MHTNIFRGKPLQDWHISNWLRKAVVNSGALQQHMAPTSRRALSVCQCTTFCADPVLKSKPEESASVIF
jgi:hypothetical protein